MKPPLDIVAIGCGHRTLAYGGLAARMPDRYRVVAGADPNPARVEELRRCSGHPGFRGFVDDAALFAVGKIADVAIIGTQDAYHVQPALRAMELGYDLLLEKPIATRPCDVLRLLAAADRLGRKVLVCHVLRYAPFYVKVHEIVTSGVLGDIVAIDMSEGVGDWHQAHSFVRGSWAITASATPMIVSKCCHDMDILSWLVDRPCQRLASFGSLGFFNAANAPAGAPARCTDGCPVGDTCPYNAMLYSSRQRGWLGYHLQGAAAADSAAIRTWLTTSPLGRCVWRCDNDAVDRQVLALEFAGGLTATFTMTAFDRGRNLTIRGTKAVLMGGEAIKAQCDDDIIVRNHLGDEVRYRVSTEVGGYSGHGGGDPGIICALDRELAKPAPEMRSGLHASVDSHLIAFAAEEARRSGQVVDIAAFKAALTP